MEQRKLNKKWIQKHRLNVDSHVKMHGDTWSLIMCNTIDYKNIDHCLYLVCLCVI